MSFSEHMTSSDGMCAVYEQQADIDLAFADYDRARLAVLPRPACATRNALLCAGCGSDHYTYNNTGANEAGGRVCENCGMVQSGSIIFEQMFGRIVPTRTSNYKRIHHWHERISQLLLMESRIPEQHMLAIGEALLDGSHPVVNKDAIRAVLRSLKMPVYIEKWLQIMERCTGVTPPCPGPIVLKQLDELFLEMQRPFDACKIESRRNFLNYNYVFCRLFQMMNCSKFSMFFPLIRSKVKLKALDAMWCQMATSLGWECPPLEHVPAFAVKVDQPAILLSRLKAQVAYSSQVANPPVQKKMEFRKWDRRTSEWNLPQRAERRSVTLEQRPQRLALRLKRLRHDPR